MGKQVYVVRGSEDGNLGVFSNKKAAYTKAVWYLEQQGKPDKSYQQVCKELNDHWYVAVSCSYISVDIEQFTLESKGE